MMQAITEAGGRAARVLLAVALAACALAGAASFPRTAHAANLTDPASSADLASPTDSPSSADPTTPPVSGGIEVIGGPVAYANTLFSDYAKQVQQSTVAVGDELTLKGDFRGGWGTVTMSWYSVDGDGVAKVLEQGGTQAAESLLWQPVSEVTIPGTMPKRNSAVVAGGKSQTLAIRALAEGESAWQLQATDEAGNSNSIYWAVTVDPASGVPGYTNVTRTTDKDTSSGQDSAGKASAVADTNVTVSVESAPAAAPPQQRASNPLKGGLPQTGDACWLVAAGVCGVAALAIGMLLAAGAVLRRRKSR